MKPLNLNVVNNHAKIRNFDLCDLANEYGTPLMVFDQEEVVQNIKTFKKYFHSNKFDAVTVYASKAFLVPHIAKMVDNEGLWIDAVSLGDLYVLIKCGFRMNHVMFHGNNKSSEELVFAIENNVNIVVDNLSELKSLIKLSNNAKVNTFFRINPGIEAHTHEFIQTSKITSKFGESIFDVNKIDSIMKLYLNNPNIILHGFHSHIGSQILDVDPFIANVETMTNFSYEIINKYHYNLDSINFGGGFGISYIDEEVPINLETVLTKMIEKFDKINSTNGNIINHLYIEPGRRLLGNAAVTLYKVGFYKETFGKKNYCFIDGGMADNIRPALYEAKYSADIANKMNNEKVLVADVAGKCCESGDVLIHDLPMPLVELNDILMIYNTAAYTYSMSSNYNNMLKPSVLFLSDKIVVAAKHQPLDDLCRLF